MIHNEVYNLSSYTYAHTVYFPFVLHFYVSAPDSCNQRHVFMLSIHTFSHSCASAISENTLGDFFLIILTKTWDQIN